MQVSRSSSFSASGDVDSYVICISEDGDANEKSEHDNNAVVAVATSIAVTPASPAPSRRLSDLVVSPRKPTYVPPKMDIATFPMEITAKEIRDNQARLFQELLVKVPEYPVDL